MHAAIGLSKAGEKGGINKQKLWESYKIMKCNEKRREVDCVCDHGRLGSANTTNNNVRWFVRVLCWIQMQTKTAWGL